MRYWVYINDKVDGPFEEDKLAGLDGFTPETLICSEETEAGANQEWVKASSIFEFDEVPASEPETIRRSGTFFAIPEMQQQTPQPRQEPQSSAQTAQPAAVDTSVLQLLIDKIDNLTREFEGLKNKVDAAMAASAAQAAAPSPAPQTAAPSEETHPQDAPVVEDGLITNTESLVNHAEKLVAQAGEDTKSADFLNEIQIDAQKTENITEKAGEEVVLRSALDSLYSSTPAEQTEEEKESTFQDLLSPAAAVAAGVGAAALAASAVKQETEAEPAEENQEAQPQPLTPQQREQIINEITAPAAQNDAVLAAIEEAQKETQRQEVQEAQDAAAQAPQAQEQQDVPAAAEPQQTPAPVQNDAEKQPLDLEGDAPQLTISNLEIEGMQTHIPMQSDPAILPAAENNSPVEEAVLTAMDPQPAEEAAKETTETVQELVPGKKIEPEQKDDNLISQQDLDEAFAERTPTEEFPLPEANDTPLPQAQEEPQAPQAEPAPQSFSNPNDMTEVELKEGATYLISDFIPPAQANTSRNAAVQAETQKAEGMLPGSHEAAKAEKEGKYSAPETVVMAEAVEEIVPNKKDEADLTISKVILENTIRTKRGATMDIKTLPMVQDPMESDRLDLSDSDLDINAQHDLKAADLQSSEKNTTKIVLGSLVTLVIIGLIYFMLAYLEILPENVNLFKSKPAATQTLPSDNSMDEMLNPVPAFPAPSAAQEPFGEPASDPSEAEGQVSAEEMILSEVQNYPMVNGQTLQQLINSRHPAAQSAIMWDITTAVEPDNYSVLVRVPPENPQSFKISYRFNYNTVSKTLDPTISDSKNLLESLRKPQAGR